MGGGTNAIAIYSLSWGVQVMSRVSEAEGLVGSVRTASVEAYTEKLKGPSAEAAATAVRVRGEVGHSSARATGGPAKAKVASVQPVGKFPQ